MKATVAGGLCRGVLLYAALATTGCKPSNAGRVTPPEEFWIPEQAQELKVRADDRAAAAEYTIDSEFPAKTLIDAVHERLRRSGYALQLTAAPDDGGSGTEAGWERFIDRNEDRGAVVHQRIEDWQNDSGDWVSVTLRYRSDMEEGESSQPTNQRLRVTLIRARADSRPPTPDSAPSESQPPQRTP